ncbi:MAG: succinate dehydrogenase/fumarate reductase iron-sulfur subunit [Chthonomonadales bacterium]|nr:succinate dehydrogenase/fumarate reductase iron-sulfur subunit [Chthonomonadales bacterium]
MLETIRLRVFRGDASGGEEREYPVRTFPGMVVLDAIHQIQGEQDGTLACRWNCKAAKCGSCSAEINGHPALMCKSRVEQFYDAAGLIRVSPLKTFPLIKDLVTDVSWNYRKAQQIPPLTVAADAPRPFRMMQGDVDRIQEFRKCIECFLCQDICHVLRDHGRKDAYFGPRFMIKIASLDMHPMDDLERRPHLMRAAGVGYCNVNKCCQEVCPEHIHITDNGIIPLKERVADEFYDPIRGLLRMLGLGRSRRQPMPEEAFTAPPEPAAERKPSP